MNVRRGIIFAYIICGTFLVAHIINAVIAEALSIPGGLARPSPASVRDADVKVSLPAMVEHIRTSGLFPLPPDPLQMGSTEAGTQPSRAPLNLASKLTLLGVVVGDREVSRQLLKNFPVSANYSSGYMTRYPTSVRLPTSVGTGSLFARVINRNSLDLPLPRMRNPQLPRLHRLQ